MWEEGLGVKLIFYMSEVDKALVHVFVFVCFKIYSENVTKSQYI